jgi:RNAse (barnase) inhibitor barstar
MSDARTRFVHDREHASVPSRAQRRVVDGTGLTSKADLIDAIARALAFPDYCGRNWDAFEECLREVGEAIDGDLVLEITSTDVARRSLPADMTLLADVWSDAAAWVAGNGGGELHLVLS